MTAVDLDRLLAHVADQMRGWAAAMDRGEPARANSRPGRASAVPAPGRVGPTPGDAAAAARAALVPVTRLGIACLDIEAVVRRSDTAPLDRRDAGPVRLAVLAWVPSGSTAPDPARADGDERLHVHIDAAGDGFVRLGPRQTPVRAGRRFAGWSEPGGADASPPPAERETISHGVPT